jgi:hypothetical protein
VLKNEKKKPFGVVYRIKILKYRHQYVNGANNLTYLPCEKEAGENSLT